MNQVDLINIKVLYFARLKEVLGLNEETVQLSRGRNSLTDLRDVLCSREGSWKKELSDSKVVRVAVNQELTTEDVTLSDEDEVAFFPPVTGG